MSRWLKRFLIVVVLMGCGGVLVPVVQSHLSPQPKTYMTAPVVLGSVEETVLANGTLKPVKMVAVGAQVSGRILALHVKVGDRVSAGDLIAEIDSVSQRNALRNAEADLADRRAQRQEKEATATKNRLTLARQQKMIVQSAVSHADLESAEADVKTVEAQIAALDAQIIEAEVAVETAKANLGYTRITAPMAGTVLAVVNQEGMTVNANQTTPTLVILGELGTMTVRAEVSEADVVRVAPGQPAYFTILGDPDHRYTANVVAIEPAPDSITSDTSISTSSTTSSSSSSSTSSAIYYNAVFNVANPDGRLKTYMTAEVHIVIAKVDGVPIIPASALGKRPGDASSTVQMVADDGQVQTRPVMIGANSKVSAEVRSGLKVGDRVVLGEVSSDAAKPSGFRMGGPPPPM